MQQILHIILKYNDDAYHIDTIAKHREVIFEKTKVIWGIIKPNMESPKISKDKIKKIKKQILNGESTYAYFVTSGHIKAKGKILDILTNTEVAKMSEYVPNYYRNDINRCIAGVVFSSIDDESSSVINELQRYDTINGTIALGNQTNPLYVSIKNENTNNFNSDLTMNNKVIENTNYIVLSDAEVKKSIENITKFVNFKGYIYGYKDICNLYLSLKTKPFVILAGISGTGKSKLVKLFSEAINGVYNLISVKPDWNDSTELLGYKNINDKFIAGKLSKIILEASKKENLKKSYFICLDEMNLARVEYYLSEYLSVIESRKFDENNCIKTDKIFSNEYFDKSNEYSCLEIPENVYIIGTVNMDDTTFAFSRKVLDRANTIEFSDVHLENLDFYDNKVESIELSNDFLKSKFINIKDALKENKEYVTEINKKIIKINNILTAGNKQFGYRVRDEIIFYMLQNKINGLLDGDVAFDFQIMQKVLPTITGSEAVIKDILIQLYEYCNPNIEIDNTDDYIKEATDNLETALYTNSAKKILTMLRGYEDGFVSYWA